MMKIIECEQNSPEWLRARMGLPTASEFKTLLGIKKDARDKVTRQIYMRKLAGEIITGEPMEHWSNEHMQRGHDMEAEARDFYAFVNDIEPQRVGFIVNGPKGCSPDSLIGTNGMLEIKTKLPHLMIECLERDDFPPEHKAQCQGALWVAEREWIDLKCYWPKMPDYTVRAHRDEPYIKELEKAVDQFNHELHAMVERTRRYGERKAA